MFTWLIAFYMYSLIQHINLKTLNIFFQRKNSYFIYIYIQNILWEWSTINNLISDHLTQEFSSKKLFTIALFTNVQLQKAIYPKYSAPKIYIPYHYYGIKTSIIKCQNIKISKIEPYYISISHHQNITVLKTSIVFKTTTSIHNTKVVIFQTIQSLQLEIVQYSSIALPIQDSMLQVPKIIKTYQPIVNISIFINNLI